MKSSYDCVVVGGGPAGSTVAALVAEAGFETLLLDREKFPRFHVGESLMPETYWTFERLGLLEKMKQSDFVKKYSVQFVTGDGRESQPFFFDQHDPRPAARRGRSNAPSSTRCCSTTPPRKVRHAWIRHASWK